MAIKIKKYEKIGKNLILLPIELRVCKNQNGRECGHNGELCACSVYSGNPELPNLFQGS